MREGKGGKSQTLPINPEQRRAFKALLGLGSDPDDPVFRSQRKAPTAVPSHSRAAAFKRFSTGSKNGSCGMSYTPDATPTRSA